MYAPSLFRACALIKTKPLVKMLRLAFAYRSRFALALPSIFPLPLGHGFGFLHSRKQTVWAL